MKIRWYSSVRFSGDWEINLIGKRINIRIGRSQIALWWDYKKLCMWLAKEQRHG